MTQLIVFLMGDECTIPVRHMLTDTKLVIGNCHRNVSERMVKLEKEFATFQVWDITYHTKRYTHIVSLNDSFV